MLAFFAVFPLLLTSVLAAPALESRAVYPQHSFHSPSDRGRWCIGTDDDHTHAVLKRCDNAVDQWGVLLFEDGQIQHRNNNMNCFDAVDANPGDDLQLRTCDQSPGQHFWATRNHRIAVTGRGMCVEVRDGIYQDGARLQVANCEDGNENQEFRCKSNK